jgi:hypothetical protein
MYAFEPYFQLRDVRQGIKGVGNVVFRDMSLPTAHRYWSEGRRHIRITDQGARLLFGHMKPDELLPLLQVCQERCEVESILALRKSNARLKKAAEARIQEITKTQ